MSNTTTQRFGVCVDRWPECYEGGYHPSCCRFPKSCSCTTTTWTRELSPDTHTCIGCWATVGTVTCNGYAEGDAEEVVPAWTDGHGRYLCDECHDAGYADKSTRERIAREQMIYMPGEVLP